MLFLEEGNFSIFFYMIITNYVIKRGSIGWRFLEWCLFGCGFKMRLVASTKSIPNIILVFWLKQMICHKMTKRDIIFVD